MLLDSQPTLEPPPNPLHRVFIHPPCHVCADELLPIQEDIQMAETCAARIAAATNPAFTDNEVPHSFGAISFVSASTGLEMPEAASR